MTKIGSCNVGIVGDNNNNRRVDCPRRRAAVLYQDFVVYNIMTVYYNVMLRMVDNRVLSKNAVPDLLVAVYHINRTGP